MHGRDRCYALLVTPWVHAATAAACDLTMSTASCRDDVVFGGGGLSMMKMQANVRESVAKVEEVRRFRGRDQHGI